ncbi:MAG: 30S ribosomal protein S16, partial [Chloroflexota bacterium]|nr:30S ribosomal protein S16 [Chloroflexota bacterium]
SLRIRLSRVGAKKQASYRIVVADSRAPRDGKAIAILGHYNPLTDPYTLKVDPEKAVSWLRNGAQPSDTARGLLAKAGVMTAFEAAKKKAAAAAARSPKPERPKREPRSQRTEPPRLIRPGQAAVAAAEKTAAEAKPAVKATTTRKAAAGKTKTAAEKPKAPAKPRAPRARAAKSSEAE